GNAVSAANEIFIVNIVLPYTDAQDSSWDNGTLLLRNAELEYYKNLVLGKGAVSGNTTNHPAANMRLEWLNAKLEPKLILLEMCLLDKTTKEPVPGLISPAGNFAEDGSDMGVAVPTGGQPMVLAELDGSLRQMMELPLYIDPEILKSGEYLLLVTAKENNQELAQYQMPLKIMALDMQAAGVTIAALSVVLIALPYILTRRELREIKSRHLITIALFGTTAFAFVNVPGTFLQDLFRIFLGPFSFLISGMFSGILLYMLLGALVVLIPKFGVVTLMLLVRMLINMFVFGHISPFALLIYGSQAVLLELSLFSFRVWHTKFESWRFSLPLACGLADAVSTYILLQSFSFLYRLFYADWYILLCMLISGFLYPAIGAACGAYLGKELKKVGVD
ncbi:MAG: MptD family putative ECF transporter S component, partial [Sporomusaceae bacterium]|nr:MptD family putative ECF transporter S component [Sporomusaceae bacterium]